MEPNKVKRIADFLEKLAVAGVALGIYQGNAMGILAIPIFAFSLYLTRGGGMMDISWFIFIVIGLGFGAYGLYLTRKQKQR
jgi:hypothetical protein